ncbi:ankyrin repeat domain-containing protein [Marinobacter sp. ANT_B65]|uniref:ankyrin repeat domain-containing protein n=1 Tax=Marinobacter sp. ANT_B65 TaxID=2039467 RepID=UPI000BBE4176|nr:ankyrin repeat domain-containing protein [Marinobacter sp. ANT_B65]PCM43739.1 hypothetical protein CPA50_15380 [Marinobacter sp. ANT_B65]
MVMNEQEQAFFKNITSKLSEIRRHALKQAIDTYNYEEHESFIDALFAALTSLDPEEHWLLMQLDWKGLEELTWQANAMARTHGLAPEFALDGEEGVEEGLQAFNDWLSLKGFVFLQYSDGSDSFHGFISRKNQSKRIVESAASAGITLTVMPGRPKPGGDFFFTRVKPPAGNRDVITRDAMIRKVVDRARKKGYRPIMYIADAYCKSCPAFEQFLAHPMLNDALKNTGIFRLDYISWIHYLKQKGIFTEIAPTFVAFTKEGEISENMSHQGLLWEEDTARQMAIFFKEFLADERNDVPLRLSRDERCKTLVYAVMNQDLSAVRRLIEEDRCDCNIQSQGYTLLHYAADLEPSENNLKILTLLLDHCSLLDEQNNTYGYTALHRAISKHNQQAAIQLINRGANVQLPDTSGKTPLHKSVRSANRFTDELFELLVAKGADVNAQDAKGSTALHEVSSFGQRLAPFLLANGADPNLQDNEGDSPLHRAARVVKRDKAHAVIRHCLQYGGDLNLENAKGQSVRQLIIDKDGPEGLEKLLSGNA